MVGSMEQRLAPVLGAVPMRYKDAAKTDIVNALVGFPDLAPTVEQLQHPTGGLRPAVALAGTIPVMVKSATYNIPVCVYLVDTHPYQSPIPYVRPTSTMTIKVSQFVNAQGKIQLPYLSQWQYPGSDLQGLLQIMVMTFQDNCPVYSIAGGSARAQTSPYPSGGSSGYTPYPPASGAGYNMPVPSQGYGYQSTPYPSAGGNTPYPSYPSYPSGGSQPYTAYPAATTGAAATPYPAYSAESVRMSTTAPLGSSSTIQPEHIRASLLSAVEDRLRRRLRDTLGTWFAELQSIRKTSEELSAGQQRLTEMLGRLAQEQMELETSQVAMRDKKDEVERVLAAAPADGALDVDATIDAPLPLHRQLFGCFVADNTIEDCVYYLGQALKRGVVPLDVYLRHVRKLSRTQFTQRATMHKCRQKAGLGV